MPLTTAASGAHGRLLADYLVLLNAGWDRRRSDDGRRRPPVESAAPIRIENNAWLAANVIVLPGITIGEGAVVEAGSVVTKDVAPKVFVAGNPCRVIREI